MDQSPNVQSIRATAAMIPTRITADFARMESAAFSPVNSASALTSQPWISGLDKVYTLSNGDS
jgi:hypothetical protein